MSDASFELTERNKVLRLAKRAAYDREAVYRIVDAALVCHVGYAVAGQPYVLPTLHAREGDTLLLHGHARARTLLHAGTGQPVCVAITHVDGVVLARSIFNHSVNYRSVTLYGTGRLVIDPDEKADALRRFTEKLLPGRWDDARPPTEQETKATAVVAVAIEQASAKIRAGMPVDDPEDLAWPTWAGVAPIRQIMDDPVADGQGPPAPPVPHYLARYVAARRRDLSAPDGDLGGSPPAAQAPGVWPQSAPRPRPRSVADPGPTERTDGATEGERRGAAGSGRGLSSKGDNR